MLHWAMHISGTDTSCVDAVLECIESLAIHPAWNIIAPVAAVVILVVIIVIVRARSASAEIRAKRAADASIIPWADASAAARLQHSTGSARSAGSSPATGTRRAARNAETMAVTAALHRPSNAYRGSATTNGSRGMGWLKAITLVALVTAAAGFATPYGQQYLPESIRSFANSAGGWTALVFVAVLLTRSRPLRSMVLATVGFLLLNNAYDYASTLRGFAYTGDYWNILALVAGPAVGLATAWIWSWRPRLAATGTGVIAAIFLGEGAYGLLYVSENTGMIYWVIEMAGGAVVLVVASLTRLRHPLFIASAVITALVGATVFVYAFAYLGGMNR